MSKPLPYDSPMEIDLCGGDNKEVVNKEKMIPKRSEAIDIKS